MKGTRHIEGGEMATYLSRSFVVFPVRTLLFPPRSSIKCEKNSAKSNAGKERAFPSNCCCQLFVFEVYTKELLGKRHLRENGKKKRDSRKGRSREPLYDELKCTPWEEKKPERDGLPRGPSAFLLKAKVIVYLPERI